MKNTDNDSRLRLGTEGSIDCYHDLANAIVLQAVKDYRMTNDSRELEDLERFFRSEWFSMLTNIDPEYLIAKLRGEKDGKCQRIP